MIKKMHLLVGFGAGYVLGAKAGTERYDQLRRSFDDLMGKPQVQQATHAVSEAVTDTVTDLAGKAKDKTVDLTGGSSNGSTTPLGSTATTRP